MRSRNQLQAVNMIKFRRYLVAKEPAGTARADGPCFDIFWIRPHQVTKSALVRNLLCTGDDTDLIDSSDLGTQPSVDTENLAINNGREDEEVEDMAASLPN